MRAPFAPFLIFSEDAHTRRLCSSAIDPTNAPPTHTHAHAQATQSTPSHHPIAQAGRSVDRSQQRRQRTAATDDKRKRSSSSSKRRGKPNDDDECHERRHCVAGALHVGCFVLNWLWFGWPVDLLVGRGWGGGVMGDGGLGSIDRSIGGVRVYTYGHASGRGSQDGSIDPSPQQSSAVSDGLI